MAYHDIPTLPEGWVTSTNIEKHISLLRAEGETRYSLAIYPTSTSTPRSEWTVMGLANYEPFRPVFTDGAPLQEALSIAIDEINAKRRGEQIDHIRKAGTNVDSSQASGETETAGGAETENHPTDDQSDLNRWV
jgi:biotin operon repressor